MPEPGQPPPGYGHARRANRQLVSPFVSHVKISARIRRRQLVEPVRVMNTEGGDGITFQPFSPRLQADVRAVKMEPGQLLIKLKAGRTPDDQDHFIQGADFERLFEWTTQNAPEAGRIQMSGLCSRQTDAKDPQDAPIGVPGRNGGNGPGHGSEPALREINVLMGENNYVGR